MSIMSNIWELEHVVVTPSRNETVFLPKLVESIANQSLIPSRWIIVSHNSEDESRNFLEQISEKFDWISVINVNDKNKRKRGAQIANLVNQGLVSSGHNWDFFSKIDADMVLPSDYFEQILSKFESSEKLGIASGTCYTISRGRKRIEKVTTDHTRGGLKTYRRKCFDEIGGIREIDGWDGIDNIMAQMEGWETQSFSDLEALHQRITGSHSGIISGCFESGRFAHSMGYLPLFLIARSIHRMASKPLFIGGISMFMGYSYSVFTNQQRLTEPEVVSFLRKKQKNRLKPW